MPFKISTLALLALSVTAQTREANPYPLTDTAALAQGKLLYSYYCVFCHGMDGVSGRGARLASTYRKHGSSDREIYRTIADGVPGTEMSGHWIEEDEIWKIVLFVRQFEAGAAAKRCVASGDAARGESLFNGKGGCRNCHSKTSRQGPDLAGIGAARSIEHLRESIIEPSKAISRVYRLAQLTTKRGERVRGILLNQDEYTVHVLDGAEKIRSFARADLAEMALSAESPMPSYAKTLRAAEIDDLLAYLCAGGVR